MRDHPASGGERNVRRGRCAPVGPALGVLGSEHPPLPLPRDGPGAPLPGGGAGSVPGGRSELGLTPRTPSAGLAGSCTPGPREPAGPALGRPCWAGLPSACRAVPPALPAARGAGGGSPGAGLTPLSPSPSSLQGRVAAWLPRGGIGRERRGHGEGWELSARASAVKSHERQPLEHQGDAEHTGRHWVSLGRGVGRRRWEEIV